MSNNLIDISEAAQRLGVTIATLRRWDASGKLKPVRTFGNHRRYRLDEIEALVNHVDTVPFRSNAYIYCRVSTKKQQESGNLQRQQERLIQYCKDKRYNVMAIYELYGARGGRKLKQTIVQTLETLEQERGESIENNDESDSSQPNK